MNNPIDRYKQKYASEPEVMSLMDYLEEAKVNKEMYLSPAERLLKAIGSDVEINTKEDPVLARLYDNKKIKTYPSINEMYIGQYDVIANIVGFLRNAARGLEASKQILYLLGPVGGGKSTLADILKRLMEQQPFYALAVVRDGSLTISPIHENPLGLFSKDDAELLNIAPQYLLGRHSPWAHKRLIDLQGDITKFKVVKLYPDEARHIAIAKTEPGDENNQDISALVGKLDISKAALLGQSDPDCYEFSGSLCRGNRGIMEFMEMFKAPIKMLHPLLGATQEHQYNPTEQFSAIPFEGIILAHSNETEWQAFKNNKTNEAFIDRTHIIKVPYELRKDNVVKIYKKELNRGALKDCSIDPHVLDTAAKLQLAATLYEDSLNEEKMITKIKIYNGENVKDSKPGSKSYQEHRKHRANLEEGMTSHTSLRTMFKILSQTFDIADGEITASTVDLLGLYKQYISGGNFSPEDMKKLGKSYDEIESEYITELEKSIHNAYMGKFASHGQTMFERYISMAEAWLHNDEYIAEDGSRYNLDMLNKELERIEKPGDIGINAKNYRRDATDFVMKYRANHEGKYPDWRHDKAIADVLEKQLLAQFPQFVPVILDGRTTSNDDMDKLDTFKKNMKEAGFTTDRMIKRVIDFWSRKRAQ